MTRYKPPDLYGNRNEFFLISECKGSKNFWNMQIFLYFFPSNRKIICIYQKKIVTLQSQSCKVSFSMTKNVVNTIEYIIVLVAGFAMNTGLTEVEAYRYLNRYGAIALCEKHYGIMHTLSVDDNIDTLRSYCRRKGGLL